MRIYLTVEEVWRHNPCWYKIELVAQMKGRKKRELRTICREICSIHAMWLLDRFMPRDLWQEALDAWTAKYPCSTANIWKECYWAMTYSCAEAISRDVNAYEAFKKEFVEHMLSHLAAGKSDLKASSIGHRILLV